jgi:biotin operon repressor
MSSQAKIDTTYQTMQRDLFSSGLAAQIGMSAFGVWQAIKAHADFETGESWPGQRKLAEMTGMSQTTVTASLKTLEAFKMLRVLTVGKGKRSSTYVARERMDVRMGTRVLCTVVIDYVPAKFRKVVEGVAEAIRGDQTNAEAFVDCEIIPGDGFVWDPEAGVLRTKVAVSDVPDQDDSFLPHLPGSSPRILLT